MKIIKLIKKNLKWITIISVILIICSIVLWKYSLIQKEIPEEIIVQPLEKEEEKIVLEEEVIKTVFVDIKGEVSKPGVYEVEENKKVIDVIQLAGGFTEQADTSYVNLAKQIVDEMVIIIYSKEEVRKAQEEDEIIKIVEKECICPEIKNDACLTAQDTTANKDNTNNTNDTNNTNNDINEMINLNTATLEELLTLNGIGESKAKAIIEYRETNGNFQTIEELMQVSGIGESLYEKIKDSLTV